MANSLLSYPDSLNCNNSNKRTHDDISNITDDINESKRFCSLECNTISMFNTTDFPIYIDSNNEIEKIRIELETSALKHQKSIDATTTITTSIALDTTVVQIYDEQVESQQSQEIISNSQIEYEIVSPKNNVIYRYARDNPQIRIECGSVFDVEPVDAIVNSIDRNFSFNGNFANLLITHCGRETIQQLDTYNIPLSYNSYDKTYEIRVTSAGRLTNAKRIINICFNHFEFVTNEPEIHFKNTILKMLKYCIDNNIRSIALPPLGTGLLAYPASFVVKWLHECFYSFFLSYTCHSMQKIIIVLPAETPQSNIFTIFYNELEQKSLFSDNDYNELELIVLNSESDEFKCVEKRLRDSMPHANVTRIVRVKNDHMAQMYNQRKKRIEKYNPANYSNEYRLFHGTNPCNIDSILQFGFNRSYCGKNGVNFGQGVYFARNANYSHQYASKQTFKNNTNCNQQPEFCMLLSRVLVGQYQHGNSSMKDAGRRADGHMYDSTVDNVRFPTIFVIYNDFHALPEYVIHYQIGSPALF